MQNKKSAVKNASSLIFCFIWGFYYFSISSSSTVKMRVE